MPALRWIFRHTLNSVPSGIVLLVLIGLYIAIGSGAAGLRERLEMDELLFFNWWPFKVLSVLLVINLMTVTITRIPLTPTRYGVWSIHLGIILLLISLGAYYNQKVEGLVPLVRGQTATAFYDRWERALYIRTPFAQNSVPLEGLPRFSAYDEPLGNAHYLDRSPLRNLEPQLTVFDSESRQGHVTTLAEAIGAAQPVTFDIIGYYPYGETQGWVVDSAAGNTGLKLTNPKGNYTWIVASESADAVTAISDRAFVEHRHLDTAADVEIATAAAKKLHKLTVKVGEASQEIAVEPGKTYEIAGYSIAVEEFKPQWPLSSGQGRADALTMVVTHKSADGSATQFRRMVLAGRESSGDAQTDFELGVEGAGPFGKRKRDGVLDANITIAYTYTDPTRLLPTMDGVTAKYVLFTAGDSPGITSLRVSTRQPIQIEKTTDATLRLNVDAPAGLLDSSPASEPVAIAIERNDHLRHSDTVAIVSPERRDREVARAGGGQMVRVKVSSGDWSQIVPVGFDQFALQNAFTGPNIKVPGAQVPFQLMLGNLRRALPVAVRLESFEAMPYAGGDLSGSSMMREFRSNITFLDPSTNLATRASASLNEPAFFKRGGGLLSPGESWIFSQASWNPQNLDFTALQVGNRPFVTNMIVACGMILGGLLYTFYLKPIIIRRMKANALRLAQARKKPQRTQSDEPQELVTSA